MNVSLYYTVYTVGSNPITPISMPGVGGGIVDKRSKVKVQNFRTQPQKFWCWMTIFTFISPLFACKKIDITPLFTLRGKKEDSRFWAKNPFKTLLNRRKTLKNGLFFAIFHVFLQFFHVFYNFWSLFNHFLTFFITKIQD